jgi:membrane-bound inhibitor of C-type lysozyme
MIKNKVKKFLSKRVVVGFVFALFTITAIAADMTISVAGPVSRRTIKYQCDQHAGELGLPTQSFVVEYLNGAGNSLAVVPIGGQPLIFANVISGSGARYAAGRFIWWDAGSRGVHLYSDFDSIDGRKQTSCQQVR